MNNFITAIYIVISILFTMNFINILKQLNAGSKKVNAMSLLATSSLILHFASLALYFYSPDVYLIVVSQIYMIACMLYIKFVHKKDQR